MSSQLQSETLGGSQPTATAAAPAVSEDVKGSDHAKFEEASDGTAKPRKRDFFRFGKKSEEDKKQKANAPAELRSQVGPVPKLGGLRPISPLTSPDSLQPTASPPSTHPYGSPASPGRPLRSASPRTHSPASSLIFERNVQEDVPAQASPQIPSHIITENHIPSVLESASEAITDSKLDPDSVEIVTHATHQPAAATIPGVTTEPSIANSLYEDMPPPSSFSRLDTDNVSNYGSLDVGDVRRLSFISFADVVHAEQEQSDPRRDSTMASLAGHPALTAPRSPSPVRSPGSSQILGTSPSTSMAASAVGYEASPNRGPRKAGSPLPGTSSPAPVSEVNIETMSQALRKTGSGDLSGFRSPAQPLSPISNQDDERRDTNV